MNSYIYNYNIMCMQMELAMQIGSTNQKVRNNTIQDLKDFNQQSL